MKVSWERSKRYNREIAYSSLERDRERHEVAKANIGETGEIIARCNICGSELASKSQVVCKFCGSVLGKIF